MKKNLFLLFILFSMMGSFLTSCKEDKPEIPPVVEDVIAVYSADKLKAEVAGTPVVSAQAKVELVQLADKSLTIKLQNIIPGVNEFSIPKATFEAVAKSAYMSKLTGEASDDLSGYDVKFNGTVDEGVLSAIITYSEVKGDSINTSSLYNLVYKGNMDINVANLPAPITLEQRVYLTKSSRIGSTKKDTSMVKFSIKNFTFEGMSLGNIDLDTVLIQKRGDVLAFRAENRKIKLAIGNVDASLNGTIIGEELNMNLDIDASGLKVGVKFKGGSVVESQSATIKNMSIDSPDIIEQKLTASSLTLRIWENTPDEKLLLTPKYELFEKVTIDSVTLYRKGEKTIKLSNDQVTGKQPIDFSLLKGAKNDCYVKYWLAAEDPNKKGNFLIYLERIPIVNTKFTFESWFEINEYYDPQGWATSNMAAAFLMAMQDDNGDPFYPKNTPLPISQNAQDKTVVQVITVDTKGYGPLIPAITAGSLFLGQFKIDMTNTLASTKFGVPYNQNPASFKGTYKFTPGTTYYKVKSIDPETNVVTKEEVVGKIDKCAISAVLYEVNSYDETLDGTNILTAKNIVAIAIINSENTNGFIDFDIPLKYADGKKFEAAKKYKLAIVCSSSENGAIFEGAPGSELLIKSLEIVNQ